VRPGSPLATFAFGSAALLGSALLFLIEPMIVKMILPRLGGSPSVWLTALVFFQATLLVGYAYSHASTNRLRPRLHAVSHVILMLIPLLFLPVALPTGWIPPPGAGPLWVFVLLIAAIGLPFFVLSTVSPVLQRWYSYVREGSDPYFLYAVGNLGSLLGLLAYPLIVERFVGIRWQSRIWSLGYVAFLLAAASCAWMVGRSGKGGGAEPEEARRPIALVTQVRWVLLAFVPSSLLLGVTSYLTAEVGSFPLLWVIPLAVYLITFIVAFARTDRPVAAVGSTLLKVAALVAFVAWAMRLTRPLWALVALHCALLLAAGLAAHGRLYDERPDPANLTRFYLLVSLGGVLGGMFNALVAPFIFVLPIEYPLVLLLALVIRGVGDGETRSPRSLFAPAGVAAALMVAMAVLSRVLNLPDGLAYGLVLGAPVLYLLTVRHALGFAIAFAVLLLLRPPVYTEAIYASRTFFGVYRVEEVDGERKLFHGMTVHGTQWLGERSREPTAYYHRGGPLGDVFELEPDDTRMVILGLGAGGISAYGGPDASITFVEIDPEVVRIASDTSLFTYLSESPSNIEVLVGDGRLGVADLPDGSVDLLIVDVFTGDAIPVHLITIEALREYRRLLSPAGKIVIHLSNRYFELEPVVAAVAEATGLQGVTRGYEAGEDVEGAVNSQWAVFAPDGRLLEELRSTAGWRALRREEGVRGWTDDYSNLLAVIR
jgi:SAM-dependent methyltransferase